MQPTERLGDRRRRRVAARHVALVSMGTAPAANVAAQRIMLAVTTAALLTRRAARATT